jgi:hypothetical protein
MSENKVSGEEMNMIISKMSGMTDSDLKRLSRDATLVFKFSKLSGEEKYMAANISVASWEEKKGAWIGYCPEIEITSLGDTQDDAIKNTLDGCDELIRSLMGLLLEITPEEARRIKALGN